MADPTKMAAASNPAADRIVGMMLPLMKFKAPSRLPEITIIHPASPTRVGRPQVQRTAFSIQTKEG